MREDGLSEAPYGKAFYICTILLESGEYNTHWLHYSLLTSLGLSTFILFYEDFEYDLQTVLAPFQSALRHAGYKY